MRRQRLLVVDDDPQTARLVREWFADRPFEIADVSDGPAALERAARDLPDLIVLDLTMPGMNGIDVARRLRDEPRTRATPVLMLTACRNTNNKVEAFNAGADDYLTKPFELEEFEARIQVLLRRRAMLQDMEGRMENLSTANEELERLLVTDEKTGLANFREFQRRLKDEWKRAERYSMPLSLVFLDLDHFKRVNDTLGHQAGDQVLREFATLVNGGARSSDATARYGGEEFAVILPHTDASMALRVAERIVAAVRDYTFLEERSPTHVTVSAGVATYPSRPEIDSADELIRAADQALYRAKDRGRNRVMQDGA